MQPRLNIVIPFRERHQHLNRFLPHIFNYFVRDKIDREIDYRIVVVEQEDGLPFNKGALINIGFQIGSEWSEYTCFHDVDYLPIWADYSPPDGLTGLVWYGAEVRPINPGKTDHVVTNPLERFIGGAYLVPNDQFVAVNGCSIGYWGWGYEDTDLILRFEYRGFPFLRRKGTYQPLDHKSNGFIKAGQPSKAAARNKERFDRIWGSAGGPSLDGLSTTRHQVLKRKTLPPPTSEKATVWEMVTVRLPQDLG